MKFKSDKHRRAVFANIFSSESKGQSKVSPNNVKNFEVKTAKVKVTKTRRFGGFERTKIHPKMTLKKKVELKAPLFPPSVINRRIEVTLDFFFEDFEKYGKKNNINVTPMKKGDGVWENNIVKIQQIENYPDGRPKVFRFTYRAPSFVNPPSTPKADIDSVELGSEHILELTLPRNYPDQLQKCNIISKTKFWSSRMYGGQTGRICLVVKGEMDRIAMHLLQQLLWEPTHDLHSLHGPKEFGSGRKDEIHEYLKQKLREMHE